jgi:carbamoyl-phosphate synthase L subunit-like protein
VKPIILLATTSRGFSPARLAMTLVSSGCVVEAVCPPRHPICKTSVVGRIHSYHGLIPLRSFLTAIASTQPDLIIPCDDLATLHLHDLYYRALRSGKAGETLCALIERSLGAPASFPVVYARTAFIEMAREEGVRVPLTEVVKHPADLKSCISRLSLPVVLKADGTSGGDGVRIAHNLKEAEHGLLALAAPPLLARALKRAVIDQDTTMVWPSLLRHRFVVNAQAWVAGREATSAIACWKGNVLASVQFEVLNKQDAGGPSTVLRRIDNREMSVAAVKLVKRLALSGLHGFDFMLEAETDNAYLIEINPRATQVGHLTLGPGHDIPAAITAAVSGAAIQVASSVTQNDTIALFPQEWIRNPASPYIRSGYHDVPWEEAEFVRDCVSKRSQQNSWYSRQKWIQAMSGIRRPRL